MSTAYTCGSTPLAAHSEIWCRVDYTLNPHKRQPSTLHPRLIYCKKPQLAQSGKRDMGRTLLASQGDRIVRTSSGSARKHRKLKRSLDYTRPRSYYEAIHKACQHMYMHAGHTGSDDCQYNMPKIGLPFGSHAQAHQSAHFATNSEFARERTAIRQGCGSFFGQVTNFCSL